MKKNKKWFIIIPILCVILVVVLVFNCMHSKVDVNENSVVGLKYVYGDENIDLTLTEDESKTILEMFNNREMYWDNGLSCGFDDEIYLSVGEGKFYPSCDGCDIIRYKGKIFHLTEEEREELNTILNKYNAKFPCI